MGNNPLLDICQALLGIFCGNNNQQNQQQGQQYNQQQGQGQQQWNQYPAQQQPQWNQAPGQGAWQGQPGQQQQQQQNNYPPGSGAWNNNNQQHGGQQQQQHGKPHGGMNQDQANATNAQYTQWRNDARREGDQAHKAFADSQNAYKSGDGARAKQLSEQGKQHQANQQRLDGQASDWIFRENNKTQPHGTIDLHGLYVKEAIERVESAIADGQRSGAQELRVITGKGIHSQNHQAKIKPAVEQLMQKYNLAAEIDPRNTGVLVVYLQGGGGSGGGRTRDAGGLVDQIQRGNQDCVIM
ncbi:Smr domain-containing protein [Vanrija pseudolonga]|uniref:Smr domain-containing protein n=1 Tax=Vanrija pseudolonga TaxID=143232 RepID=A0AAF0YI84_9TREE|nr:Smr domain-containing protein [Vanrija pseudolonga]